MKKRLTIWVFILCVAALSSCRVQKDVPTRYHTLTQRATTTLVLDEHRYSMSCTVQLWRNELVVISLQPMLGIEMARVEASKDSVWVFDKMNRRYAVLSYHDAAHKIHPVPSYKMIQDFVTEPVTPKKSAKVSKTFTAGEHRLQVDCSFSSREYDTLKKPSRQDTRKYKRVSLHTILPI